MPPSCAELNKAQHGFQIHVFLKNFTLTFGISVLLQCQFFREEINIASVEAEPELPCETRGTAKKKPKLAWAVYESEQKQPAEQKANAEAELPLIHNRGLAAVASRGQDFPSLGEMQW